MRDAIENQSEYTPVAQITEKYILQPNDYLFLRVTSPDDEQLTQFFNPIQNTTQIGSGTQNTRFMYYGLDDSCRIDFPIVGKIDLTGCTVQEAKEKISQAISKLTTNFTLVCRLSTNTISVLGEVNKQNQYIMQRDQVTIFEALAEAGGFTSYAKRNEVKLFRKGTDGKVRVHNIDMSQGATIESEYYYVYPNDVLYVRPMWYKMFGWGETMTFGLFTSLLSLIAVIISISKK